LTLLWKYGFLRKGNHLTSNHLTSNHLMSRAVI